jgi:hypothetical protein
MTFAARKSRALAPALSKLSGIVGLDRASSFLIAVALVLSVALAGKTASRIVRIERDHQPALDDTRLLSGVLEATRTLLRDGRLGPAEIRLALADSQAQRFHDIATSARPGDEERSRMLAHDASFGEYYVAARRAAAGVSMSLDADGSSAEDARLGFNRLRDGLVAGAAAQEEAMDAARPATSPIELAGWLALTLLSAAALLRRSFHRQGERAAPAAAPDDYYVPIPAGDGRPGPRLQDAVERMARKRLAASVAAARVAKRNNERQIELARSWNVPMLSIVPAARPMAEMDVYMDEEAEAPRFSGLRLVSA